MPDQTVDVATTIWQVSCVCLRGHNVRKRMRGLDRDCGAAERRAPDLGGSCL